MRQFDRWFFSWPGSILRWLCRLVAFPSTCYILYLVAKQISQGDQSFALFVHTPIGIATWVSTIVCLLYLTWDMAGRDAY